VHSDGDGKQGQHNNGHEQPIEKSLFPEHCQTPPLRLFVQLFTKKIMLDGYLFQFRQGYSLQKVKSPSEKENAGDVSSGKV
jgi:hypothetical protein